jgi:hypothetical protein
MRYEIRDDGRHVGAYLDGAHVAAFQPGGITQAIIRQLLSDLTELEAQRAFSVEQAYYEGYSTGYRHCDPVDVDEQWRESRARKLVEGRK